MIHTLQYSSKINFFSTYFDYNKTYKYNKSIIKLILMILIRLFISLHGIEVKQKYLVPPFLWIFGTV